MITTPLMTSGVRVKLPKTSSAQLIEKPSKPLVIVVNKYGEILVKSKKVSLENLRFWLENELKNHRIQEVEVAADKRCNYGKVAKLLSMLQSLGITNVALLLEINPNERR